jgi:hypothetical protein
MNEDALRALIRDSIARHLGGVQEPAREPVQPVPVSFLSHASHYRYGGLVKSGDSCVIEPNVTCNHCGYCESHGH